eukprot:1147252-Pelagomonas_calceolata.AAC.3
MDETQVSIELRFMMKFEILSSHQFACMSKERWRNGVKSRGRGRIYMRNVFGHNIMQLMRVREVKRLGMSGRRLMAVASNWYCKSLPQRVPDHRKVALLTGRVKAVIRRSCQAVLEIGMTCLTACFCGKTISGGILLIQFVQENSSMRPCVSPFGLNMCLTFSV